MSQTTFPPGGLAVPAETRVAVDQVTISGDGSSLHPLRVLAPGALGTPYVFVYRPGDEAHDNVYTDWALLMTAQAAIAGDKLIQFDASLAAATVPAGTYAMSDGCTFTGHATFANGATFTNVFRFWQFQIAFDNATPAITDAGSHFYNFDGCQFSVGATHPFLVFTGAGHTEIINVSNNHFSAGNACPKITMTDTSSLVVNLNGTTRGQAFFGSGDLTGDGGGLTVNVPSWAYTSVSQNVGGWSGGGGFQFAYPGLNWVSVGDGDTCQVGVLNVASNGSPITVLLPAPQFIGEIIKIYYEGSFANPLSYVIVDPVAGSGVIGERSGYVLYPGDGVELVAGGISEWFVTANKATRAIDVLVAPAATVGAGETILTQVTLPGTFPSSQLLAVGDAWEIFLAGISSSTGTLTFRVRMGTLGDLTDAVVWTSAASVAQVANARASLDLLAIIRSIGATGTVVCDGSGTAGALVLPTAIGAFPVAVIDTTFPPGLIISVTCTCSVGTFTAEVARISRAN